MSSEIAQYIPLWVISLLCASSFFLSSPCCYKVISLPFKRKSLFSFVIRWKSSSFFVFFNGPSSVFFFFLSNLIWEIHFEGRVLINKTPSNIDLLPKTTRYQHLSEFLFLFFYLKKKKNQILHALFLLKIYLFSCWVLKKICGYMLCNFCFILWMFCLSKLCDIWEKIGIGYFSSNPPFSIQVTLDWDLIF